VTAELTSADHLLLAQARAAAVNARPPFSHFAVGAAVRTASASIHRGGNVELSTFKGMCAEQVALATAVAAEGPEVGIEAIAVWGEAPTMSPCGNCRQTIFELGPKARVLFARDGTPVAMPISELLPIGFRYQPDP